MLFPYLDMQLTVIITNDQVSSWYELPPIFDWVVVWQMYRAPAAGAFLEYGANSKGSLLVLYLLGIILV